MRADMLLVAQGLSPSRQKAKEIILSSSAFANGVAIKKPSQEIPEDALLTVNPNALSLRYVGRGGLKLEGAVKSFGLTLENKVCMDIGASTGGFTDCLLQNGAQRVYAVDVGHGQLAEKLLKDTRVINLEGTNIRELTEELVPEKVDFVCSDVSFISLSYVFPVAYHFLKSNGQAVFLIKPQFEVGKQDVGKNGIVKDPKVHDRVLQKILANCTQVGFSVYGLIPSPIRGGDGNIEYLLHLGKEGASQIYTEIQLKSLVQTTFQSVKHNK